MKRDIAQAVADRANTQFDQAVEALSRYLRIPAISCDPTHHADVRKLAAAIRDDLHTLGLK